MADTVESQQGIDWLVPRWPAPDSIHALSTLRGGGVSHAPYASLNLAGHVGDDPQAVRENRERLHRAAVLPAIPRWLTQVHGTSVAEIDRMIDGTEADATWTAMPGVICAVLTADCLPVLLCDVDGTRVAAVHAGWRGLAAGVIEAAVAALSVPGRRLLAWLGPAIGPTAFEVGSEVRAQFVSADVAAADAFRPSRDDRCYADLYTLARLRLAACGVVAVSGGEWCTYRESERFFSYRRDGQTGRMATLIWRAA